MQLESVFRRSANRIAVTFAEYGAIPVASSLDDLPVFETGPPKRIGDDAIIFVEGQRRKVRLLRSVWCVSNGTYLVDMGAA